MERRYYFDTNIWIDLYENRGKATKLAKSLFKKVINSGSTIFYSKKITHELKKLNYSQYEINLMLSLAKPDNLRKIHIFQHYFDEARKISRIQRVPEADAFHAIVCRNNNLILVSRDQKDFIKLSHICKSEHPKNLL